MSSFGHSNALTSMKSDSNDLLPNNHSKGSKSAVVERSELLDQSIGNVLEIIREVLAMDLAFVSRRVWDEAVISHASASPCEASIQGERRPLNESFC